MGPNGAGKTTTIKTLLGFRRPDSGSARVLGYDVVDERLEVWARVGFASEVDSLYESMTVPRLCAFCRDMSRSWDQDLVDRYLDVFGVPRQTRVRRLSKGQKAQVQFSLARERPRGPDPGRAHLGPRSRGPPRLPQGPSLGDVAAEGRTVFFSPTYYYYSDYGVGTFALTNLIVCLISAALPLLAALWLFNRKAY